MLQVAQEDELDKALAAIRGKKKQPAPDPMDSALAEIRQAKPDIVLPAGKGNPDIAASPEPMRLRPVVVSKPESPAAPPPVAQADATRVGPESVGLEERLRNEHPTLLDATVQTAKSIVEHPIDTGVALAETPFKGGRAVGEYVKGGRLNEGKGRAAAIGAAQTAAMLLGGPAERLAEPVVARVLGEAAAPLLTRTAVGAATGATFTPDRPAVGALLGGAAGALSSRGVAAEKAAARQARFEELVKEHPDWFGESIAPEAPKQLGDGTVRKVATARIVDEQAPPAEPDYTVEEPASQPIIDQKGVFGGALEQHGKDFAEGKTAPPTINEISEAPKSVVDPNSPIHPIGDEAPAAVPATLPATLDEVDAAIEANGARYSKATDPAERKSILKLHDLLEEHRATLAPPEETTPEAEPEKESYDFASTQVNLPHEAAIGIKNLGAEIPDEHLAENGREENPHITVKYGLHGKPLKKVRELLADEGPITVKMGKTSHFPASESGNGDVVKVDIDSPDLHRLNKKIAAALPHTDTHPEYKPHATIAYVKPGMGEKYSGNAALEGHEWTLDHVSFSDKDGKQVDIPLRGKKREVKVKPPIHDSARLPSGGLRENLHAVKDDGLIREMFQLLGAENQRDQQAAIYRTVDDVNMARPVTVPTIKGGRNLQAEALHRIELKKGAAKRIEEVLNSRGLTDEHITRRYMEMTETEADLAAEREGLDSDRGDTSFDFEEEGGNNESDGRSVEGPAGKEAAKSPPAGEAEGTAKGLGRREIRGPLKSQARSAEQLGLKGAISAREMAQRAKAGETREAVTAINGEEPTPLSKDKKQSELFSGEEVGEQKPDQIDLFALQRAKVERVKDAAVRIRDKVVSGTDHGDAFNKAVKRGLIGGHDAAEVEEGFTTTQRLFVDREEAYRIAEDANQLNGEYLDGSEALGVENLKGGLDRNREMADFLAEYRKKHPTDDVSSMASAGGQPQKPAAKRLIEALDRGVPITGVSKFYDTSGTASRETLQKFVDKPYVRQLAQRFEKAFADITAAIQKRYGFPPVEFGGFDVSRDALGMNIARGNFDTRLKALGFPGYDGPTSNLIVLNPYIAIVEIGLNPRLRPTEYPAALSENMFGTMVHEIAHQYARGHDEEFAAYHTRYAAAASPIASQVLGELDMAWEVALQAGMANDVIQLQQEVWDVQQQQQRDAAEGSKARPEPSEGNSPRLSLGRDAIASHLRPSEGDGGLGKGDGRRRLGVRADVRGSETRGDKGARSQSAEPGRAQRLGEKRSEAPHSGNGGDRDVALTAAASRFDKVVDDARKAFAPASRGPLAREAANITREQVARMAHENEIARSRLAEFAKAFDKMPREERLAFIDRMENMAPQKTEQLSDAADAIRDMLDSTRDAVRGLGLGHLENFIENYFPHIWASPETAAKIINQTIGKRPLEGTRSFLKRRTIPTLKEGIELGLEPISTNPVDLSLLKLREMNRYLMGQRLMNELKAVELTQFVHALTKAPEGYARINDHVAMVYGPPDVPVKEAFDAQVRQKLVDVIKALDPKLEHERTTKMKGKRWGEASTAGDHMRTRFGGDATVIMHELGHILDFRYKLWDRLIEPVAKRTATKGKAKTLGKQVPDKSHPSNSPEAVANRKKVKDELRALADLRYESAKPGEVGPTYKKYVREKEEQIANAVHAYIYARAKMQRVAPTVFARLDEFIKGEPKLRPLADVEPSLELGTGSDRQPVGGLVVKGQYWAPEAVARIINNYLSPGLRGNSIYDAYMGVGNVMNGAQLGLSAFHLGFTSMEAAVSRVALSLRMAAAGKLGSAAATFLTAPAAPLTNYLRGRQLYNAYLYPDHANAEMTQVVRSLVAGGGRIRMDDFYKSGAIEGLKKALESESIVKKVWGVTWRAYPAFVELTVKPILEHIVPRQKMGVFSDLARLEIEKLGPNPDPADVRSAMARVWDSVDNRMGQLVYDNLFWNKTGKDLAMASVRAVGWNLGTVREIGGGLVDFTKTYKRYKAGEELLTTRMSYVLALPLFVGLMGAIYNYLATGEPPKEMKDYWYPRTGRIGPDGNPERVQLPSYMKDVWAYAHHPVHTIESKLHPAIETIVEMLHNKDFYGTMIVNPEDPILDKVKEYGAFMAKHFQPFAIRNAIESRKRGAGLGTAAQNFVGVTPAPREVVRTPAQNKMAEYLARHSPELRTPEEADKGELHRAVVDAVRKGQMLPAAVTDATYAEAGERPVLNRRTLFKWIHEARLPSSASQFKRLSVEEAEKVWDLANDDEKVLWADAYRSKVVNSRK